MIAICEREIGKMKTDDETRKLLVREAIKARENAYVPYSNFAVGAALLTKGGKIYRGCNIECGSYSPTNCAERTAFFKAVSEGEREFAAIGIVGGMKGGELRQNSYPCGVCRQVMSEFCDGDFEIIIGWNENEYNGYTLDQMLPFRFELQ